MLTAAQVKKLFKNAEVEVNVKKISINGNVRGASGFIKHTKTNRVVYISTEQFSLVSQYLYRCARHDKDYSGGRNRYANEQDELFSCVMKLLSFKEHHTQEFGVDFDKPPKVTVPDFKRHVSGSAAFF